MALAVAIFQDLFIIVFFLFLPLLLPHEGENALLPAWVRWRCEVECSSCFRVSAHAG
jgi:hypothetical protein